MRIVSLLYALLTLVLMAGVAAFLLMFATETPLPDAWNPVKPLSVSDHVTPLTPFKLKMALADGSTCKAALATGADFEAMENLTISPKCGISDRVLLRGIGAARIRPVETRCQTALRIAMWHRHGVEPAAQHHFGQAVRQVHHASSYSCRAMRTTSGNSDRMSSHATAEAIDVTGVTLADGRRLNLISGWNATDSRSPFFHDLHDSACTWFRLILGPDYNRLHADHFHLQHTGWGLCR